MEKIREPAKKNQEGEKNRLTFIIVVRKLYAQQNISWNRALEKANNYLAILQEKEPESANELEAMAHGAELPLRDIVAINAPHELRSIEGCTTIVTLPSATLSGHTLIGKNYDEPYQRLKTDALFVITPDSGLRKGHCSAFIDSFFACRLGRIQN